MAASVGHARIDDDMVHVACTCTAVSDEVGVCVPYYTMHSYYC